MMAVNRKSHSSSATRLRPTLVRRHNDNITRFLRQLPKVEKMRMVPIESDWDITRVLMIVSRLDARQRRFIETICGTATVPDILEKFGMRRYAQLLAFLTKLDAALVKMSVHPSELYYMTPALYGSNTVITRFDLAGGVASEVQEITPFDHEPRVVVLRTFRQFCDTAGLLKGDRSGIEFAMRTWERIADDRCLQPLSVVPAESEREKRAREVASTLADAFIAEANAPDFAIPEQVINDFVSTLTDEHVFGLLFVRSTQ